MNAERVSHQVSNLEAEYLQFKERAGFSHALGIIGGSSQENVSTTRNVLVEGCRLAQTHIGNFAIVSGGTKEGIPALALDIGHELGMPTIGVYPQAKEEKYVALEKIDFAIPVPSQPLSQVTWGIETPILVSIPDAFVLVGGEWGTLTEISMIIKRNSSLLRHGKPSVPIISVAGSGKLADCLDEMIHIFPADQRMHITVDSPDSLAEIINQTFQ